MKSFDFMIKKSEVMDILASAPEVQKHVSSKTVGENSVSLAKVLAILYDLQEKVRKNHNPTGTTPDHENSLFYAGNASEWEFAYCQFLVTLPTYLYVFSVKYIECIQPYLLSQRKAYREKTKLPLSDEHADLVSTNGRYPQFAEDTKLELQQHLNAIVCKNESAREALSAILANEHNVIRRVLGPEGSRMIRYNGDRRSAHRPTAALKHAGLRNWNPKKFTKFLYEKGLFYRTESTVSYVKSKYTYSPYPFMKKYVTIRTVPGQRIQWWFEDTFGEIAKWLSTGIVPDEIARQAADYSHVNGALAAECDKYDLWQLYL